MSKYCSCEGCTNYVFGGGYCKDHQWKRGKKREYSMLANDFKKANPFCKAKLTGCTKKTNDVHHMKGRIGKLLTNEQYFLPVCRNCHKKIEQDPWMAKEKGLSLSRLINNQTKIK